MACISSSVYCEACGSSPFDSTPPVAQILIRSAPYLMFCRTLCCTCRDPVGHAVSHDVILDRQQILVAVPAGDPSSGPLTSMCGPGTCPALIASRRSTSTNPPAPTLRTEVNPAIKVVRALTTPLIASFAVGRGQLPIRIEFGIPRQMRMHVDQPRHHRHSAQVDHRIARPARPLRRSEQSTESCRPPRRSSGAQQACPSSRRAHARPGPGVTASRLLASCRLWGLTPIVEIMRRCERKRYKRSARASCPSQIIHRMSLHLRGPRAECSKILIPSPSRTALVGSSTSSAPRLIIFSATQRRSTRCSSSSGPHPLCRTARPVNLQSRGEPMKLAQLCSFSLLAAGTAVAQSPAALSSE